jgi:MerR family transcriptional regulator, thiopeptide resistance regulator
MAVEIPGGTMSTEQAFAGFQHNPYESEARQRWGDEAVDGSIARMSSWSPQDAERARTGYQAVHQGLAELLAAGVAADDDRVQQLIEDHYQVTCLFWTPTRQSYLGLAQTYQADERFARNIGGDNLALVSYLCDGMGVYASTRLG